MRWLWASLRFSLDKPKLWVADRSIKVSGDLVFGAQDFAKFSGERPAIMRAWSQRGCRALADSATVLK
jgi:hypothetical protein